ncbi:MAG: hypothetical protein HP495_15770 [Nitrospira sp.]|nr:hypothetical protein [Nitrospira sp.]
MFPKIKWPDGKDFAFTIFDDPDQDTVENSEAIYPFLRDLGFRTTKAVWPIQGDSTRAATCEDQRYLKLVLELQQQGFEIGLHNATSRTSTRERTALGLNRFQSFFGHSPYSMANHTGCGENIYWGSARLSGIYRALYQMLNLRLNGNRQVVSQGHLEGSPLFWGDFCKEQIKYVRNFVFGDINTLKACPVMPYHDTDRPFVNYWFASSEGANINLFNTTLSEESQDRLADEGGACIMYTHFASGFQKNGRINDRFRLLMERLSKMNGWFVPVNTLLDHILRMRGHHVITRKERSTLERRWMWHKIAYTRGRS